MRIFRFLSTWARVLPAAVAALVWALAAATAVYWGLQLPRPSGGPAGAVGGAPSLAPEDMRGVQRALGQVLPMDADASRRFALLGVIAARSGQGSALLSIDGQPAQAFVQGQSLLEGWRLLRVNEGGVRLQSAGGTAMELELPSRP